MELGIWNLEFGAWLAMSYERKSLIEGQAKVKKAIIVSHKEFEWFEVEEASGAYIFKRQVWFYDNNVPVYKDLVAGGQQLEKIHEIDHYKDNDNQQHEGKFWVVYGQENLNAMFLEYDVLPRGEKARKKKEQFDLEQGKLENEFGTYEVVVSVKQIANKEAEKSASNKFL